MSAWEIGGRLFAMAGCYLLACIATSDGEIDIGANLAVGAVALFVGLIFWWAAIGWAL